MRAANFLYMVRGNLLERKGRTFGTILVVAFAAAIVTVVASIAFGFLREIVRKAEEYIPPDMLMVRPKAVDVAMFSLAPPGIAKTVVEDLRATPGIAYVAPQIELKIPVRANGTVMGQTAETDAVVIGVGEEVVRESVLPGRSFADPADSAPLPGEDMDHHTTSAIPCIAPRFLLDMYNLGYAAGYGLPKINEGFLHGKEFTLMLGGPTVLMGDIGNKEQKTGWLKMRIVGVTSNASLRSGIYIPLTRAEALNKWYTGKETNVYPAVHIKVSDPNRLNEIVDKLQKMDLLVENQREFLDKVRFMVRAATLVVALFALVVAAISAVSIVNTFSLIMAERRGEVSLLRAVGARRSDVVRLYLAEVATVGLIGGLAGAGISVIMLRYANTAVLRRFSSFPFLPEVLFRADFWILISVTTAAVAMCVIAVLPGINSHSKVSPTESATA